MLSVFFIALILLFQFLIFIPGFIGMGKEEKKDNGEDKFELFHFEIKFTFSSKLTIKVIR